MKPSRPPSFLTAWARALAFVLLTLAAASTRAEIVDRIEVNPVGSGENEIVIWFLQDVVFLRSVPPGRGQLVRIYFQTAGYGPVDAGPGKEIVHGPPAPGVPKFVVTYPEQDQAMTISFAAPVAFRVRQVHGPRSISLFLTGEGSSRLQTVEPKVVAAIPDVLRPTPAKPPAPSETRRRTAESPVTASVAPAPPVVRSVVEPKTVAAIPDLVPPAATAAKPVTVEPATAPPAPTPGRPAVAAAKVVEPKEVAAIPDVLFAQAEPKGAAPKTAAAPSKTKPAAAVQSDALAAAPGAQAVPTTTPVEVAKPPVQLAQSESMAPPAPKGEPPPSAPSPPGPETMPAGPPPAPPAPATAAPNPAPTTSTDQQAPGLPAQVGAVAAAPPPVDQPAAVPAPAQTGPLATPMIAGKKLSASDQEAINRAQEASAAAADDFAPVPLAKVEEVAADLLAKAKAALAANDAKTAVQDLNRLLSLPRNASSQEAQELIGVAWEKSVEVAKARSEYELYLRLYPTGKDADRVKERIARLPAEAERPMPGGGGATTAATDWTITGGISQNFYTGASHIEILTPPPPGQLNFNQTTLSMTDQKALVTSTDLNARKRVDGVETRIAFRDTYTANFLPNQTNQDRLSTLYFEQNDRKAGYQYRVGRQSGTFGAVGLFDGAYGAYQATPDYRVSAVAGEPTQLISSPVSRNIWGVAVEKQSKLGKPGGTLYFVQQHADGYLDRAGVGVELRYFDEKLSGFSMLDYDLAFKQVNIAMLQGNWRYNDTGNLYFLMDRRKAPLLQLTNALPAATSPAPLFMPAKNIPEALLNSGVSIDELRRWAADTTALSELYSFGGTQPINDTWQIGGDVSLSRISSTNGAGSAPPQPSSGMAKTFNAQVIGNRLLTPNDTDVVNVSYIMAPTYRGQNLSYNHSSTLLDSKWRIDLALRYYHQTDVLNALQSRFNPSLRTSYRLRTNLAFEAEIGGEKVHQEDASGNVTDSTRKYFYAGYRWDLQ